MDTIQKHNTPQHNTRKKPHPTHNTTHKRKNNDNKGKKDIMIEDWETEKIFNQKHK